MSDRDARCAAVVRIDHKEVRCGLPARHTEGGPKSHCANRLRGDGSTWTGDGFVQWD